MHNHDHNSPHDQELHMLNAQAQFIAEQLDNVDSTIMETEYLKNSLDEIKQLNKNSEILAPFSAGIFLKANLKENDKLLVNVGKGVVVEKSVEETKSLLSDRINEMSEMREKLTQQLQLIEKRLIELEDKV